ncbi:MAG: serine hydrolase domain-containing protein [Bacteroidota bacterium]
MKRATLLSLCCILAVSAWAQTTGTAALDAYMDVLDENSRFMGSMAVSQEGDVVFERAIGYQDQANDAKADTDTRYRIGSISKMFTSVLTLKAVEEGKISLNTTLEGYFPELENAEQITVEMMLNHSSGIFSFTSDPTYLSWSASPQSREKLMERILAQDPSFAPGERHSYSNSNYVLLTWLLEDIHQTSFGELLATKITEPLALGNTYVGGALDLANHECYSYTYTGAWQQDQVTDMSVPLGAGAIISTPKDLTVFIRALFEDELISSQHLEMMMDMQDGYGLGMFRYTFGEDYAYGHTGGIDSFTSFLGYMPERKTAVAITSNGTRVDNMDLVSAAYTIQDGGEIEIPTYSTYAVATEDLAQYEGVYASPDVPLKITVFVEDGGLMAQATGQSSFPLEPTGEHAFAFDMAGITMEFTPESGGMVITQGGSPANFKREEASSEPESSYSVSLEELEQYEGVYASDEMPLKITVFIENDMLNAQATGQGAFPLTPTGEHTFAFDMAGITMEFSPGSGEMVITQGGSATNFKLEE